MRRKTRTPKKDRAIALLNDKALSGFTLTAFFQNEEHTVVITEGGIRDLLLARHEITKLIRKEDGEHVEDTQRPD